MSQLVISINPDLKNEWGHYLHYDERLKEVLEKEGNQIIILAGKNIDPELKEAAHIIPKMTLPSNHFHLFSIKHSLKRAFVRFWKDSIRFAKEINIPIDNNKKVTYFMYLATFNHIPAIIIHALYNRFRYRYVLNLFYFHFSVGLYSRKALSTWKSIMLRAVKRSVRLFKIRLCTDSQELNQRLKVNFDILPMFSTTRFSDEDFNESDRQLSKDFRTGKRVVAFPGLLRQGKGFDKSVELIQHVISTNDPRFFFFIRKVPHQRGKELYLLDYLKLIETERDYVRVYEGILSDSEYKKFFTHSDIIFISYRRDEFHTRTSAVLSDAVILRKPVAGPRTTWTGNIIEKYSLGVTYEDGDIEGMYQAIQEIDENYSFYKKNLNEFAQHWVARCNPARVVSFILGGKSE